MRYAGLAGQPVSAAGREVPAAAAPGAVFAFDLRGGREAGQRFIESLRLWSHLANVGDAKSLVIHPASTTHRQLSDEELVAAGIGGGTIRLSVGLETLDDLIWDLERGLRRRERRARRPVDGVADGGGRMTQTTTASCAHCRIDRPRPTSASTRTPMVIREILHTARTIAIVGLSSNVLRPSNFVGFYLQRHGYRIVPVNPRETRGARREGVRQL